VISLIPSSSTDLFVQKAGHHQRHDLSFAPMSNAEALARELIRRDIVLDCEDV